MAGLELIPLARVVLTPGAVHRIHNGPFGERIVAAVGTGRWEGDRISGAIVGAGGDWATPGTSGAMLIDVRQVLETDDGAIIAVTYNGRGDRARKTYTVAPTFETSDERYAWLNLVQAVGRGSFVGSELVYEMYEVR